VTGGGEKPGHNQTACAGAIAPPAASPTRSATTQATGKGAPVRRSPRSAKRRGPQPDRGIVDGLGASGGGGPGSEHVVNAVGGSQGGQRRAGIVDGLGASVGGGTAAVQPQ
jgi:hypothetical protein